jgi:hypothetical protein
LKPKKKRKKKKNQTEKLETVRLVLDWLGQAYLTTETPQQSNHVTVDFSSGGGGDGGTC